MFEQLAAQQTLRAAATVGAQTDVDLDTFDTRNGSIAIVAAIAARTVGTMTISLLGSWDGGTTYPTTLETSGAISDASKVVYLFPASPLPPNLRIRLTPASSFDGTVSVALRAAGAVQDLD